MKKTPLIYIVTPVFNDPDHTLQFLQSFAKQTYTNFKVVIVDNSTNTETQEAVKSKFPDTILIKGKPEYWWSAGTNKGVQLGLKDNVDYILTVNDDVELSKNYLESLVKEVVQEPKALIGSKILDIKKYSKIWYLVGTMDKKSGDLEHVTKLAGDKTLNESQWLTGMGVLVPVSAFEQVGLYDEKDFPHYFGDADFSLRAKQAGYKLLVSTKSVIYADMESSWLAKWQKKPSFGLPFKLFFSRRSPYQLSTRIKFYRRYWSVGAYPVALMKLYFIKLQKAYLIPNLLKLLGLKK